MPPDLLFFLVQSLVALSVGFGTKWLIDRLRLVGDKIIERESFTGPGSYSYQLKTLTDNVVKSSQEMDLLLAQISKVTSERENLMAELDLKLKSLEDKEKGLKERIELLEKVPIPVAEYFVSGEKRSARRDYALFGAGVVVSFVSAVVLKLEILNFTPG